MSLCNIALHPSGQRASVSVDTRATMDGRQFSASKLFAIPHLNALVCGTGLMSHLNIIAGAASVTQTLDELCSSVPGFMQIVRDEIAKAPSVSPDIIEQAAKTVIAVVAYTGGRIVARVWNGYSNPNYAIHDIAPGKAYCAPFDDELRGVSPINPEEHERIARGQVARRCEEAERKGMGIGGKLLYAEVSETGIRLREICDLDVEPAAQSVQTIFSGAAVVRGLGGAQL